MDHLVEDPHYYTMLARAEKAMKRRNKYDFKWWHGVLGLIGASMVLGTVRAVAANTPTVTTGSYRNYLIELQRGTVGGWGWRVYDQNREEIGEGQELLRTVAYSKAQDFIDWYLDAG